MLKMDNNIFLKAIFLIMSVCLSVCTFGSERHRCDRRPCGLSVFLVSLAYGTNNSHIKGYSTLCSYAQ